MLKLRYVTKKPHRTALWGVYDNQQQRFVYLGALTRRHAHAIALRLNAERVAASLEVAHA